MRHDVRRNRLFVFAGRAEIFRSCVVLEKARRERLNSQAPGGGALERDLGALARIRARPKLIRAPPRLIQAHLGIISQGETIAAPFFWQNRAATPRPRRGSLRRDSR